MVRLEKILEELKERHRMVLLEADKLIQEANDLEVQIHDLEEFVTYTMTKE